jgi:hypothetical protein
MLASLLSQCRSCSIESQIKETCTPRDRSDIDVEECEGWCQGDYHCDRCKCKACAFCPRCASWCKSEMDCGSKACHTCGFCRGFIPAVPLSCKEWCKVGHCGKAGGALVVFHLLRSCVCFLYGSACTHTKPTHDRCALDSRRTRCGPTAAHHRRLRRLPHLWNAAASSSSALSTTLTLASSTTPLAPTTSSAITSAPTTTTRK